VSTSRYLAAIAELADAIVDMPLDKLSPFHRDLDAAIKQRDIAVHQALNARANRGFLEEILDDEKQGGPRPHRRRTGTRVT